MSLKIQINSKEMEGQGIFSPEFYLQFRPFYPESTFLGLARALEEQGLSSPFQITDMGCGTGHSTLSLLQSGIPARVTGIDPDPAMIEAALRLVAHTPYQKDTQWKVGSAENIPLTDLSTDAIIVGSAFHWMNADQSALEFYRILKPKGILRLFEYQFPKALNHPALNDWIRKQFNEKWRAPGQVPRGTFKKVTQIFRDHSHWRFRDEKKPKMILSLSPEQLIGLILSQSRVYHYERTLNDLERLTFQTTLAQEISDQMHSMDTLDFDFKLHWVEFQKN